jgi:hypothetical protein
VNQDLNDLFKERLDLLKQAYLAFLKTDIHADYEMQAFAKILDLDANFVLEYIDWIYKQKEEHYYFDDHRHYSFLWKRDDYAQLIKQVIESIYDRKKQFFYFRSVAEKFFILEDNEADRDFLWGRQDCLLSDLIQQRHQDVGFMQFIFKIVMLFSYKRRHQLTAVFLTYNKNFETFKKIPLEPSFLSYEGSAVPMYQRRIEYFESLLPLFNTVEFLKHKQYVEQHIQSYREVVEREKKKDFMED